MILESTIYHQSFELVAIELYCDTLFQAHVCIYNFHSPQLACLSCYSRCRWGWVLKVDAHQHDNLGTGVTHVVVQQNFENGQLQPQGLDATSNLVSPLAALKTSKDEGFHHHRNMSRVAPRLRLKGRGPARFPHTHPCIPATSSFTSHQP